MACCVCWYGHVLRREDGHVLRPLDFEVEVQRKKGRLKRTWKKQVEEESVKVALRRQDALCRSMWCVGVDQIAAGLRCSGHPQSDWCWVEVFWPPSIRLLLG